MDVLYKADNLKAVLGDKYIGPDTLLRQQVRIAKFDKIPGSDGYNVELYCTALPAQFFTIKALDSTNSRNEPKTGFSLSTGSGMLNLSLSIAKAINEGMLALDD